MIHEIQSDTYKHELSVAAELARAAGAEILRYYGTPLQIQYKGDISEPVTAADQAANNLIVRRLEREFPDDGLLSEEAVDTERRLGCERVWIIDPLDGTNGFIDGNGDFAVQIGLSVRGEIVLGVVYQPVTDALYWAVSGGGAWIMRDGAQQQQQAAPERLHASSEKDFTRMRLAASRTHRSQRMNRVVNEFKVKEEIMRGSVGIKVGLIIEQQCDLYIHLSSRSKQWDTCAPEIILREAGGVMTDLFGGTLRYNSPDVWNRNGIAATNNLEVHQAVIGRLAPLLAEFGRQPYQEA